MAIRELVTWFLTAAPSSRPPSSTAAFWPACWGARWGGVGVPDVVSGCLT